VETRIKERPDRRRLLLGAVALAVAAVAVAILASELFHDRGGEPAMADEETPASASDHLCASGLVPVDGRKCGPDSAPVKIIEMSDYQCPWCKRFVDTTEKEVEEQYVSEGLVQIEFRNFAVTGGNQPKQVNEATLAAEAAECANDQGRYWEYHYKLYAEQQGENQGAFLPERLKQFAADLGLDQEGFDACLDSHRHYDEIMQEREEAIALGARGTPTLVINGQMVPGYLPFDRFQPLIEEALAKAKDAE
jgi:protein-disulfide isomerase